MTRSLKRGLDASESSSTRKSKSSKATKAVFKDIPEDTTGSRVSDALDDAGSTTKKSQKSKGASCFKEIASHSTSGSLNDTVDVITLRNTANSRLLQTKKVIQTPQAVQDSSLVPTISALEESSILFDEFGSLIPPSEDYDNDPACADESSQKTDSPSGSTDSNTNVRKKSQTAEKPNRMMTAILQWIPHRQTILDEVLRGEGTGDGKLTECTICKGPDALYKCSDCFGNFLYCSSCLTCSHSHQPLHRVLKYNGTFFQKTSLRDLGLRIQLGHENGGKCHNAARGPSDFTVVHVNGIHRVSIDFCECGYSGGGHLRYVQLLRTSLFPATLERPATAITFDCLETFLALSYTSKINTYDFYVTLSRMTDNTGREPSDARYHEFSLATRLWRHFCALKRAGQGHDPSGADATTTGQLAVRCPACPNPGRNLPDNWRALPKQSLYTQFLAVDANFRLKHKDRKLKDVELAPGWGYFVESKTFFSFLENFMHEKEVNTCRSQHNALLHATTLNTAGYLASGVGAVVCGRHSFVRPSGVIDLQLGERYVNMDYIVLSTLANNEHATVFITYDIACQWSKNFRKRQLQFPPSLRLSENLKLRFGVPSFHIAGHGPSCQASFSLNLLRDVGRTYGEGIESQWSHMNAVGTSTREQAPAMRAESLEDHWHAYNWERTLTFSSSFKKLLITAITQYRELSAIFVEFSSTFAPEKLSEWTRKVTDWEEDSSQPNPYAEVTDALTLKEVRLQLANEEAVAMQDGPMPQHEMTASAFLSEGLELEERQRVLLLRDTKYDNQLNKKTATLQESRNSLWAIIEIWRRIQDVYMPCAASIRVMLDDAPASTALVDGAVKRPETLRLCLPSSIPAHLIDDNILKLRKKEARLRVAQAEDALSDIRRLRRTMTGVSIFKRINVSGAGQKPNTRVRKIYDRLEKLCKRAVARYRAAYAALTILEPEGGWKLKLKVLHDADVSGPMRDRDRDSSEGRFKMSWIWCVPNCNTDVREDSVEFSENMRVEWSRARARAARWSEEIELLVEEMRRVVADMEWRSAWWREQQYRRIGTVTPDVQLGLQAYANKQAAYMHDIGYRCVIQWAPIIHSHQIPAPWLAQYIANHPLPARELKLADENVLNDISRIFA